ncbi:synaptic vesicle 2-related protein-like [Bombyx mandarina]|uniref:Synaptic vesicle 2-related protein-like n=1 Tax=Bombyx mandarina TaxID=7092 RepID=A0A6J2JCP4_BOMMA|nr:synaptic vesicle 2-related protein-like [Bombyx mandarina]
MTVDKHNEEETIESAVDKAATNVRKRSTEKSKSTTEKSKKLALSTQDATFISGFGLYSILLVILVGVSIISFVCIGYSSTILVPTSACELQTTSSQQGILAAGPVVGTIVGSLVWGYLADTRGRRLMLLVSLMGSAIINIVASISVNWIMLLILQFIAALFASGLYSMSMSLLSESVPMAKRNLVILLVTSIFLLSQGFMAALALPIIPLTFSYYISSLDIYWNSWRTLVVIYSIPCICSFICFLFMQESPKFVHAMGDEQKSLEILRIIHKYNHLGSKKEFQVYRIKKAEMNKNDTPSSSKDQIVPLFRAPLLKPTIIMTLLYFFQQVGAFMMWLPTIANQFVQVTETGGNTDLTLCEILNSEFEVSVNPDVAPCALNETALLMVLAVGALQCAFNTILSLMVTKIGRRNIVIALAGICGLAGILVNVVPNTTGSIVLFGIFLMGIIVMGLYTAIIVAIFPTHLRAMAIALPLTASRITTFISIQILNLMLVNNCDAGFYLFTSIFTLSAVIAAFLPDDRRLQKEVKNETEAKAENITKL